MAAAFGPERGSIWTAPETSPLEERLGTARALRQRMTKTIHKEAVLAFALVNELPTMYERDQALEMLAEFVRRARERRGEGSALRHFNSRLSPVIAPL